MKIFCSDCKTILSTTTETCYHCGSLYKTVQLHFEEKIQLTERVRSKSKRGTGKRKVRLDWIQGYESSSNGALVYKERIIDQDNDLYFEIVRSLSGEVIRFCKEPLSEHKNRGYAKFKNPES